METIADIINSIKERADKEYDGNFTNRAICRGNITISGGSRQKLVWITNVDGQSTTIGTRYKDGSLKDVYDRQSDTLTESGQLVVSKNKTYANVILHEFSGHHEVKYGGNLIKFDILSSSNFQNPSTGKSSDITRINIATCDMSNFISFKDMMTALEEVCKIAKKKEDADKAAIEAQKRIEEIQRQEEDEKKRSQQIEEQIRLKEKAEQEIKDCDDAFDKMIIKYAKSAYFIRRQAYLQRNPVLDKMQDEIKRSHVFDGTVVVIDGGPGTGKTTTMIQRLKFLISKDDLADYWENNEGVKKLTKHQIEVISDKSKNWIFFSPTELLRQFLRDNMNYEGLTDTNNKTVVWNDYLKKTLIRDQYKLAGDDLPFEFPKKALDEKPLFTGSHPGIIKRFTREYIDEIKKRLDKVASINSDNFCWKHIGKRISEVCIESKDITTISALCRIMFKLDELKDMPVPDGYLKFKDIVDKYNEKINHLRTGYIVEWKKDEALFSDLLALAKSWKNNTRTDEEEEESDQENDVNETAEGKLRETLTLMLKRLAINTISSVEISGRAKSLYDKVSERIRIDDLKDLAEYAYFMQYFFPVVNNFERFLFSKITTIYKSFRRKSLKGKTTGLNKTILKQIVEGNSNKPLCQQEQALLIGFINNLIISIYSLSHKRFDSMKHKYVLAYKEVCRPVIGIDEATDYSVVDYYAISSLKHYEVSSITLTGDIMQGLKSDGITDWMNLRQPIVFKGLEVLRLTKSYRQSPKLMHLADTLYEKTIGTPSPYTCYIEHDDTCPLPLLFESDDEYEKAKWISQRVLEVKNNYKFVPSIAVFVADSKDASKLKELIDEDGWLERSGIDVKDCSEGDNLSSQDTLRIFPLEKVKGMEFEVVFFHNIDKIKQTKLISRYLYVGLSRATFYMGVTANNSQIESLSSIINEFDTVGNWVIGEE